MQSSKNWMTSSTVGTIVQALSVAGHKANAEKIMAEFQGTLSEEELNGTSEDEQKESFYHNNAMLNALAKLDDPDSARKAEAILRKMVKPDVAAYNRVLECCVNVAEAERAEGLLFEMERHPELFPTNTSYRHVISCYAKIGDAANAEKILDRMLEEYNRGNGRARPNVKLLNLPLAAYANSNSPDAAERAMSLLRRIEQLCDAKTIAGKPDVVSYTLALKCYLNSRDPEAGEKCEAFIDEMEKSGRALPNTMTYSTAIQVYGSMGKPVEAERLLERMYKKYKEGKSELQPNTRTFSKLLPFSLQDFCVLSYR